MTVHNDDEQRRLDDIARVEQDVERVAQDEERVEKDEVRVETDHIRVESADEDRVIQDFLRFDADALRVEQDDRRVENDDRTRTVYAALRNLQLWATVVIVLMVLGLFWLTTQQREAIDTLRESAARTEQASVRAEQILEEMMAEDLTSESVAFSASVRRAVEDIQDVKLILCAVEVPPEPCTEP